MTKDFNVMFLVNLLRFEIKVTKMKYLEKYGIKFLGDLTDKDKLKLLLLDLEILLMRS